MKADKLLTCCLGAALAISIAAPASASGGVYIDGEAFDSLDGLYAVGDGGLEQLAGGGQYVMTSGGLVQLDGSLTAPEGDPEHLDVTGELELPLRQDTRRPLLLRR